MEHTTADAIPWTPQPSDHFTGEVNSRRLHEAGSGGLTVIAVRFSPGARSDWHHHPDGQVLYIVEGSGLVATREGQTSRVHAGDVIWAPPGEIHWHGAAVDTAMTNLSLTTGGATRWLPAKVTDEEYQAATA
jgi:quercetin dioxygenase-like cupin family protein